MKRVLQWLGDYWYVPLLVGASIIGWVFVQKLLRSPGIDPFSLARSELDAIEAKREARELRLKLGEVKATQRVKVKYATKLKALEELEDKEVVRLERDPEALAKFLARVTDKR